MYLLRCVCQHFYCFLFSQRGFAEALADDGLLEIVGLKHGWHASFVMVELINAKHIAQVQQLFYCCHEYKYLYGSSTVRILIKSV